MDQTIFDQVHDIDLQKTMEKSAFFNSGIITSSNFAHGKHPVCLDKSA